MFAKNQEFTTDKIEWNSDGESYATMDNHRIILDQGVVGDEVLAKIVKQGQKTSFAKVLKVLTPSINRRQDRLCQNTNCDGCALIESSYGFQAEWKKGYLSQLFGFDCQFIPSDDSAYRNKIVLPFKFNYQRALYEYGLYKNRTHEISAWGNHCPITLPEINQILRELQNLLNLHYSKTGLIVPLCRVFMRGANGRYMVGLVLDGEFAEISEICEELRLTNPLIKSLFYEFDLEQNNSVLVKEPIFVTLEQTINLSIGLNDYIVSPQTFFQANLATTDMIISYMRRAVRNLAVKNLFDICSGIGVLSKGLGGGFTRFCFENNEFSFTHELAKKGENDNFIVTDMAKIDFSLYPKADVIILDPPRKGLDLELITKLNSLSSTTILYLSCNPITQKRDLELLSSYQIKEIIGFDMFPQTPHIESLAILSK